MPPTCSGTQMTSTYGMKIDVHHHVIPSIYREGNVSHLPHMSFTLTSEAIGRSGDSGESHQPLWTVECDRKLCENIGVRTAILSLTAPGPVIDQENGPELARQLNDFQARICSEDPSHYGFFACLPDLLMSGDAALEEITRAFDVLHADGIVLYTSYKCDGQFFYLGHPIFEPIWAALNARKAVVFIHPGEGAEDTPVNEVLSLPDFDFPHETGRTAIDMVTRRTLQKFPSIKVILAHAGGDLPWLIYRAATVTIGSVNNGMTTEEMVEEARKFYFDTALSSGPVQMSALKSFAKRGHILFGSAFPYAGNETIELLTSWAEKEMEGMSCEEKKLFENGAALELFPRLRQYYE